MFICVLAEQDSEEVESPKSAVDPLYQRIITKTLKPENLQKLLDYLGSYLNPSKLRMLCHIFNFETKPLVAKCVEEDVNIACLCRLIENSMENASHNITSR